MAEEEKKGWNSHRWSGWPGAWCLDCGASDPVEEMMNDPDYIIDYDFNEETRETIDKSYFKTPEAEKRWEDACNFSCTEPGSRRYDPYNKDLFVQADEEKPDEKNVENLDIDVKGLLKDATPPKTSEGDK